MKARPVALRWSPGLRSSLGPDSPLPPGNSLIRHVTPLTSSAPSAPLLAGWCWVSCWIVVFNFDIDIHSASLLQFETTFLNACLAEAYFFYLSLKVWKGNECLFQTLCVSISQLNNSTIGPRAPQPTHDLWLYLSKYLRGPPHVLLIHHFLCPGLCRL